MALKKPQKCQTHAGIPHAPEVLSPGGVFFPFTVAVSIQMVREKATWADFIMAEHHVCEI